MQYLINFYWLHVKMIIFGVKILKLIPLISTFLLFLLLKIWLLEKLNLLCDIICYLSHLLVVIDVVTSVKCDQFAREVILLSRLHSSVIFERISIWFSLQKNVYYCLKAIPSVWKQKLSHNIFLYLFFFFSIEEGSVGWLVKELVS